MIMNIKWKPSTIERQKTWKNKKRTHRTGDI